MRYMDTIEAARLVTGVEITTTTGDVEYPGTAIEVADEHGEELFHVVMDSSGERQVLLFAHSDNYRIPLARLEKIVAIANEKVRLSPGL